MNLDKTKYNAVVPKLLNIVEGQKIENTITTSGEKYQKYLEWLEANNIKLWATITNDVDVSEMMLTYDDRNVVINNIYSKLVENNYKIVNIDFKKINDINSFYRFLIELSPRLRESGIKTIVTYNDSMNEDKVKKIVDYIVKEE